MFVKASFIKRKLINLFFMFVNHIENNGNCNFDKNGEAVFIKNLFNYLNNHKIGGGNI
jgi:hypothetical protein